MLIYIMTGKIPDDLTTITLSSTDGKKIVVRVKFLAKGGLGSIFLDLDTKPQRLLKIDNSFTPDKREGFQRELDGAALLFPDKPPEAYKCYIGMKVTDAYSMPLIPNNGPNIAQRNENNDFADPALQELPLLHRLKLFDDIAEQIQQLHKNEAIMPDLKPDNVLFCGLNAGSYMRLIDGGGVAKLTDIAKSVAERRQKEEATASAQRGVSKLGAEGDELPVKPGGFPPNKILLKKWEPKFLAWKQRNFKHNVAAEYDDVVLFRTTVQAADTTRPPEQEPDKVISPHGVITGVIASDDFEVSPTNFTPEISLSNPLEHSISKQSDIYNMGRILFTLLGGNFEDLFIKDPLNKDVSPIKKAKPFAQLEEVVSALFPKKIGESLSENQKQLKTLLMNCFKETPIERPDINELRAVLQQLMQSKANVDDVVNNTKLPLAERVDWLLTQLANRGATADIQAALQNAEIQGSITKNPLHFYQFFKTIYHLRADKPEGSAVQQEVINDLIKKGASIPENHYAIFKTLSLFQGMNVKCTYSLDALKLTEVKQMEYAQRVLKEFSGCGKIYNSLINADFFKPFIKVLFDKSEKLYLYQTFIKNKNLEEQPYKDILSTLDTKLYDDALVQADILSTNQELLKNERDPLNFAAKALNSITTYVNAKVPGPFLQTIMDAQAKLCDTYCLKNITIDNIVLFSKADSNHVLVQHILTKLIVDPGNETFIQALIGRPDVIKGLLGQDPKIDKVLFSTKNKELLSAFEQVSRKVAVVEPPESELIVQEKHESEEAAAVVTLKSTDRVQSPDPTYEEVEGAIKEMGFLFNKDQVDTNPEIMKKLMDNCGIVYREHPAIQALLTQAIPFDSMKRRIIEGIVNNPAVANTLVKSAKAGVAWDAQKELIESMHFTVLLEVITTLMVNDIDFANKFQDALMKQRGPDAGSSFATFRAIHKQTKDVFAAVKTISVEPGIWRMRCWREHNGPGEPTLTQVKAFIAKHKLSGFNESNILEEYQTTHGGRETHTGLQINIAEAMISQLDVNTDGCDQNARSGAALIQYLNHADSADISMPIIMGKAHAIPNTVVGAQQSDKSEVGSQQSDTSEVDVQQSEKAGVGAQQSDSSSFDKPAKFWEELYKSKPEGNVVSTIKRMPAEWTNLYESWNMQFVATKFSNISQFILPKLFIPATLSADSEQYMATRIYSLWLTLNFMNEMIKSQKAIPTIHPPKNQEKLFTIWAEENERYAKVELLPKVGVAPEQLDTFHREVFQHLQGDSSLSLANSFITIALAIKDGVKISQESPTFMQKYGGRSALLLIAAIAFIIAGGVTFGATATLGIGLLAAGGFLGATPFGAAAVHSKSKKKIEEVSGADASYEPVATNDNEPKTSEVESRDPEAELSSSEVGPTAPAADPRASALTLAERYKSLKKAAESLEQEQQDQPKI
jgi:serine/threonine protein kinase